MSRRPCRFVLLVLVLLLPACEAPAASPPPDSPPFTSPALIAPASATLAPATLATAAAASASPGQFLQATRTPDPEAPETAPPFPVCSPLEDLSLAELADTVVNPFNPPPPGSDDPHQGVDFAILSGGQGIALAGGGVRAVLPGRVAAVLAGRFPYGNALLIETPLDQLPPAWLEALPTPGPTLSPNPALTCPDGYPVEAEFEQRSFYLLYAHMEMPPDLQPGDRVGCGQSIGAIGSSGNALNPHLHLEARLGPASARLTSFAHYDSSASPQEMANYCAWRVSGLFQVVDPLRLLLEIPQGFGDDN